MYTLGRAMAIQTAGLTGPLDAQAKAQAEAERDAHIRDAFVNTLMPVGANEIADVRATAGNDADEMIAANAQAQHILARVLMILQVGLQVYDPTQATHVDFKTGDVVRALAHGGRVNIRIPATSTTGTRPRPPPTRSRASSAQDAEDRRRRPRGQPASCRPQQGAVRARRRSRGPPRSVRAKVLRDALMRHPSRRRRTHAVPVALGDSGQVLTWLDVFG